MSIVKKNVDAETVGIKPAVAWSTLGLVALGVVLCVLDKTGVIEIDDSVWLTLIGAGVGAGGLGAAAPAALQRTKEPARTPSVYPQRSRLP